MGWYRCVSNSLLVASSMQHPTIADIGAGMGAGVDLLRQDGFDARGFDIDPRLDGINAFVSTCPIESIESKSFDVVTCMDVIEHVVHDMDFLRHLRRIARHRVYISTPNFTRSRAVNVHHARELTIPQFLRHYCPDILHVGSPDGWHNTTCLIHRVSTGWRIDHGPRRDTVIPRDDLSDDLSFADSSVDGQEWPHMLGEWR